MTTKTNNLESLATGNVVSGDTASSGDQLTLVRSGAATTSGTGTVGEIIFGDKSLKCVTASGESAYAYWAWTSVAAVGARCAFRMSAAPGVAIDLVQVLQVSTGTKACSVRIGTDGKLYVKNYNAAATIYTTPSALTLPGVFQIDLACDPGSGSGDGKITFAVYDSSGALTAGMSAAYEGTTVDAGTENLNTVNFGKLVAAATAVTYEMDAFKSTDAYALVGPFVQGYDTPQSFGWHVIIGQ